MILSPRIPSGENQIRNRYQNQVNLSLIPLNINVCRQIMTSLFMHIDVRVIIASYASHFLNIFHLWVFNNNINS